jgi:hypothetical protein
MVVWEEIHGFASSGEYQRFVRYIEAKVSSGVAREQRVDPLYGKGMIYGGRWFQDLDTGGVWRLIPPDPPFLGLWEPIAPFPIDYID